MEKLTRIVAAVVDTKKAIFYKEDGSVIEMLQGDVRLRPILEYITPLLIKQQYADVDFTTPNSFKDFEEVSNGVRFFKIAKAKLGEIFRRNKQEVDPTVVGTVPIADVVQQRMCAVQEIMEHATPVKDEKFTEQGVAAQRPVAVNGDTPKDQANDGKDGYFDKHDETIVAVTKNQRVVPGVERIKSQIEGAVKNGNTRGMEIFLTRMGNVLEKREHTIEDLLRFMERGDLPVANDGTIIIYKKLYRRKDHYVDPHSQKVIQKVGSFVHMDEKMVDPNRRNECSHGLHVGRRGYMGSFSGDVMVLAKVRPEDVIAVPNYDANKMRVSGYHIIFELTPAQYQAINSNRPISDAEGGAELLGRAISGDHIGIIEDVEIGGSMGTNLKITPRIDKSEPKKATTPKKKAAAKKAKAKKKAAPVKALDAQSAKVDKPVNVKKVAAKTKDVSKSLAEEESKPITQTEVVKAMWDKALSGDKKQAEQLIAFKKKAKKSWTVWGLPSSAGDTLKALLDP